MGEVRYFLRLGDIAGPSIVEHHVGELELTELSWGLHWAPTSIASPVLMHGTADGLEDQLALVFAQIELRGTEGLKEVTRGWDVARNVRL